MPGGEKLLGGVLSENNLVIVKRDASPSCKPPQIKSMQPLVSAPFHFYQAPHPHLCLPLSFFFSCTLTRTHTTHTHTKKDNQRGRQSESLNLIDYLDKKDVFITLHLDTFSIMTGKNRVQSRTVNNIKGHSMAHA